MAARQASGGGLDLMRAVLGEHLKGGVFVWTYHDLQMQWEACNRRAAGRAACVPPVFLEACAVAKGFLK